MLISLALMVVPGPGRISPWSSLTTIFPLHQPGANATLSLPILVNDKGEITVDRSRVTTGHVERTTNDEIISYRRRLISGPVHPRKQEIGTLSVTKSRTYFGLTSKWLRHEHGKIAVEFNDESASSTRQAQDAQENFIDWAKRTVVHTGETRPELVWKADPDEITRVFSPWGMIAMNYAGLSRDAGLVLLVLGGLPCTALLGRSAYRHERRRRLIVSGRAKPCVECGYDLLSTPNAKRCPECGEPNWRP